MHVKVFTTGGTIDKIYFDERSSYEVGEPQIGEILHEANVQCGYDIETLMRKDSLEINEDDRRLIHARIAASDTPNILITHGTDTIVETARTLLDIGEKTIVLVGSLSPARFKNSDALFNIGFAFAAAQLMPHGVYVTMHGCIFDPRRVRKNQDTNQFELIPGA